MSGQVAKPKIYINYIDYFRAAGLGVVVGRYENKSDVPVLDGHILVRWFDSFGSGVVPEDHEYLEVVSESR